MALLVLSPPRSEEFLREQLLKVIPKSKPYKAIYREVVITHKVTEQELLEIVAPTVNGMIEELAGRSCQFEVNVKPYKRFDIVQLYAMPEE